MGRTIRTIRISQEDLPNRRNIIVEMMIMRGQKAGAHKDKRKKREKDKLRKELEEQDEQ